MASSPSVSPALPFAQGPARVKFHLEDTLISPEPSGSSSEYDSDSDFSPRTSVAAEEKRSPPRSLSSRVDTADDAPGTLPDEYYNAAMAPWRAAIRRRLVKNLKHESEWIGAMQVLLTKPHDLDKVLMVETTAENPSAYS